MTNKMIIHFILHPNKCPKSQYRQHHLLPYLKQLSKIKNHFEIRTRF